MDVRKGFSATEVEAVVAGISPAGKRDVRKSLGAMKVEAEVAEITQEAKD